MKYQAYTPILIGASIFFECYNVAGVWNGNMIQMMAFIAGATFILFFSIFRVFFSTVIVFADSYVLFGISAVALIIYILSAIFSRNDFGWAHYLQATTVSQLKLLKIRHLLVPLCHYGCFISICALVFLLFFRIQKDFVFAIMIVVIVLLVIYAVVMMILVSKQYSVAVLFFGCLSVLPAGYSLASSIVASTNNGRGYKVLPIPLLLFLGSVACVLLIAVSVVSIIYFYQYRKLFSPKEEKAENKYLIQEDK
ncbi:uncharacterized protein MONOS_1042 [Monocercomonoides exilis]|uniref:uncharacterized protein n=1 Tax=Monocercomonoides exilis TaxID=2049356 RepID=UPI00355ABEA3|nr:hypothetical protein MONOS_1042 [Monocercomonoides exilis]